MVSIDDNWMYIVDMQIVEAPACYYSKFLLPNIQGYALIRHISSNVQKTEGALEQSEGAFGTPFLIPLERKALLNGGKYACKIICKVSLLSPMMGTMVTNPKCYDGLNYILAKWLLFGTFLPFF